MTWSSRVHGTATLNPTLIVQGSYFYRAPVMIERGEFPSTQMTQFSVRQKLMPDKAAVSLWLVDPFNTMRFKIKAWDEKMIQLTERSFEVRAAFLTFQYNLARRRSSGRRDRTTRRSRRLIPLIECKRQQPLQLQLISKTIGRIGTD